MFLVVTPFYIKQFLVSVECGIKIAQKFNKIIYIAEEKQFNSPIIADSDGKCVPC
jgi:hypothetical protein